MPRVNIFLDQPLDGWSMTNRAEVTGDLRHYYAAPLPLRVLLVTRGGMTIADLRQGATVLAQIGNDPGTPGFVLAENRRHTKISVLAAVPDAALPTSTLSGVLARAPGAKRRTYHGGGRPRLAAAEPTVRITASVPESYWQAVIDAGYGDISAGVRRIIAEWKERSEEASSERLASAALLSLAEDVRRIADALEQQAASDDLAESVRIFGS